MVTTIFCEFSFNSGHWLPLVPDGHKCRRQHGHTYRVRVTVGGERRPDGFILDYEEVRKAWLPVFDMLDHRVLNDVSGLENPTCEIIAEWIACLMWPSIKEAGATVASVELRETETAGATVRFGP